MNNTDKKRVASRLMEFFLLGVCMGVIKDLLAIYFATDAEITLKTFKVAVFVAVPFAIIAELIVDLKIIRKIIHRQ